jgi:hydroxypyruvate reductase
MSSNEELILAAKEIFRQALKRADAEAAVLDAARVDGPNLLVRDESVIDLSRPLYVVAVGKAAYPMSQAIDRIAGKYLKEGVVSGTRSDSAGLSNNSRWQTFLGGHPLPNEESLAAAKACLAMLDRANRENASVLFLISGGGSAMMDLPSDPLVELSDLRELNQILVTSGVSIAEINSVRRAVSAVKGGGLALQAPNARQVSLIISDTRSDDVTSVASGPSLLPAPGIPDPLGVVEKYQLEKRLSGVVMRSLNREHDHAHIEIDSRFYVLLDNRRLVDQAAGIANGLGFATKTDDVEHDEMIAEGVAGLLDRALAFKHSVPTGKPVCFVSGGEFGCEVNGSGLGGRNCETVLRAGILAEKNDELGTFTVLSCGTDGIDGNSPATGGVINENTFKAARAKGLDAKQYLENSDSYTFLKELDAAIQIGPTGTNVRDLRIVLAV